MDICAVWKVVSSPHVAATLSPRADPNLTIQELIDVPGAPLKRARSEINVVLAPAHKKITLKYYALLCQRRLARGRRGFHVRSMYSRQ